MNVVYFQVAGVPVPQGSTRAFIRGGRAVVTADTRKGTLQDWRQAIAAEARRICGELMLGPVVVDVHFVLPRPASRPKRERHPDRKPDIDKLARAALDALTGVVLRDDAQVTTLIARKAYATENRQPGVMVTVTEEPE